MLRLLSEFRSALILSLILIVDAAEEGIQLNRCKVPVERIKIRSARKESLLKGLIALGLVERSKSGKKWFIEIVDKTLAHQLSTLDWTNELHCRLRDDAREIFAPQQVKVKGKALGIKNHERLVLCKWVIESKLHNGYCTDPSLSLSGLAKLLGVKPQTLRKQIKLCSFPFRYYPGSTCKPIGKFGSVFVASQNCSSTPQLIYNSDVLNLHGQHIQQPIHLPRALKKVMVDFMHGKLQETSAFDFYSSLNSADYLLVRRILPFAPFGLDSNRWHLSFPNITARIFSVIPECWLIHAQHSPNEKQPLDNEKEESSSYTNKIEAIIEAIKAELQFRNAQFEGELPHPFLELVAWFINDLLHEVSREARQKGRWQDDSIVVIDSIIPRSEAMLSDLIVSYRC